MCQEIGSVCTTYPTAQKSAFTVGKRTYEVDPRAMVVSTFH